VCWACLLFCIYIYVCVSVCKSHTYLPCLELALLVANEALEIFDRARFFRLCVCVCVCVCVSIYVGMSGRRGEGGCVRKYASLYVCVCTWRVYEK
jgi:hypothetical protein